MISLPATLAATWAGCGHATTAVSAGLKFVLRFDLRTRRLYGPQLAPARTHDQAVVAQLPALPLQSLFIGDLGFFNLDQFAAWAASERYWLSRYKVGTVVYGPTGARLDLVTFLEEQRLRVAEWPIQLGGAARLPCRLIAQQVPAQVVRERRAALTSADQAEGRDVNPTAWALARWTLLVTNAPAARLSTEETVALGEARWQVELLIKRWKSLGQVDEWQTDNPARILTEVHAKLLVQVLQHGLLVLGCWAEAQRSLWRALHEIQRWGQTLAWAWGWRGGRWPWRRRSPPWGAAAVTATAKIREPTNGYSPPSHQRSSRLRLRLMRMGVTLLTP